MKRKVLILIDNLKIGGGGERTISLLTKSLSQKYIINILTFHHYRDIYDIDGKYYSFNEIDKFPLNIITKFRLLSLYRIIRFYKFIKSTSPDIIISAMEDVNFTAILTKIIFRMKIPLIISIFCNPKSYYQGAIGYVNILMKFFYRLKAVNKIITISKGTNHILEKHYNINKNKIKTIYCGIELDKIMEMRSQKIMEYSELFYNKNIIKFFTVGRLSEEKGHRDLIEAFALVQNTIPDSTLFIRGDGPMKKEILSLIRTKNLEEKVYILGMQKNIFNYIFNSDIFILSSKHEAFGMALIEALACETPIVSTDCIGPLEILEDGKYGILIKKMNPKELADKMIYLAKNQSKFKELSKLSLSRAKMFDQKVVGARWVDLIETLLN